MASSHLFSRKLTVEQPTSRPFTFNHLNGKFFPEILLPCFQSGNVSSKTRAEPSLQSMWPIFGKALRQIGQKNCAPGSHRVASQLWSSFQTAWPRLRLAHHRVLHEFVRLLRLWNQLQSSRPWTRVAVNYSSVVHFIFGSFYCGILSMPARSHPSVSRTVSPQLFWTLLSDYLRCCMPSMHCLVEMHHASPLFCWVSSFNDFFIVKFQCKSFLNTRQHIRGWFSSCLSHNSEVRSWLFSHQMFTWCLSSGSCSLFSSPIPVLTTLFCCCQKTCSLQCSSPW